VGVVDVNGQILEAARLGDGLLGGDRVLVDDAVEGEVLGWVIALDVAKG